MSVNAVPNGNGLPPTPLNLNNTPSAGSLPTAPSAARPPALPATPSQGPAARPNGISATAQPQLTPAQIQQQRAYQQQQAAARAGALQNQTPQPAPNSVVGKGIQRAREAKQYDNDGKSIWNPSDGQDLAREIVAKHAIPAVEPTAVAYAQSLSRKFISDLVVKSQRAMEHRVTSSWGRDGPAWPAASSSSAATSAIHVKEEEGAASGSGKGKHRAREMDGIVGTEQKMWRAQVLDPEDPYSVYMASYEYAKAEEKAIRAERITRQAREERELRFLGAMPSTPMMATSSAAEMDNTARAASTDIGGPPNARDESVSGDTPAKKSKLGKSAASAAAETSNAAASGSSTPAKGAAAGKKGKGSARDKFSGKPGKFLQQQQQQELVNKIAIDASNQQIRLQTGMNKKAYSWLSSGTSMGPLKKGGGGAAGKVKPEDTPSPGGDVESSAMDGGSISGSPAPGAGGPQKRPRPGDVGSGADTPSSKRSKINDGSARAAGQGATGELGGVAATSQLGVQGMAFPEVFDEVTELDMKDVLHREIARGGRGRQAKQMYLDSLMVRMALAQCAADQTSKKLETEENIRTSKLNRRANRKPAAVAV